MRHVNKVAQLVIWLSAAAFVLAASAASAQTYPPDVGSLAANVENSTPEPGSEVELTGRTLDSTGNPLQGAEVTFTLTSNPGDASFSNGQSSIVAITDENGLARVSLNTGSQMGVIVVAVEANGLVSQVTMTTGEPAHLPTSGGPPPSGESIEWPLIVAVSLAVLFVAAGGVKLLRSRRI